jgi:hypothetical protein
LQEYLLSASNLDELEWMNEWMNEFEIKLNSPWESIEPLSIVLPILSLMVNTFQINDWLQKINYKKLALCNKSYSTKIPHQTIKKLALWKTKQ